MKIVKDYPPNIEDIKYVFGDVVMGNSVVFTYGDKLYNPNAIEIQNHLMAHETVHQIQQKEIGASVWWERYLNDKEFRLKQELEAYATQYRFVKDNFRNKIASEFLYLASKELSSDLYGNLIDQHKAATNIRLWTR